MPPRRPGDIMTMVADTSRIRATLDWTPQYDDLDTIAAHALAWEEKLFRERQANCSTRSRPEIGREHASPDLA